MSSVIPILPQYAVPRPSIKAKAAIGGGAMDSGAATITTTALDGRAPRYTSFPTADRFVEAFSADDYARNIQMRRPAAVRPLSIYIHIPFCESLCFYCGCNKKVTKNHDRATRYIRRLVREMELVGRHLGADRRVSQMHWGGGTPTFLRASEIRELMRAVRDQYFLEENGEYAIEVDPRTVDHDMIVVLAGEGFNRMSLGIQDFDSAVQKAINRHQTVDEVKRLVDDARNTGFKSLNFDLIYGLPLQTIDSFGRSVEQVIDMRPDRIALYNYAHLPGRFKAQRQIRDIDLPLAGEKLGIFNGATQALEAAGYVYIGMDHFALPDDSLARAKRRGTLHRNFQGYSTQPECDLIGLGASAISRVGACYSQNERGVRAYEGRLDQGELPVARGIELSRDDLVRRTVINALMCQGVVEMASISLTHLIDFTDYFARELKALDQFVDLGLVRIDGESIEISQRGQRNGLRAICSVFDPYYQTTLQRSTYSKVL